jgi:phage terminase large subunit
MKLTEPQKQQLRDLFRDPVRFASRICGAQLWSREAELLDSIANCRRTAVKACHGAGKTYTLALAVLWWLARYENGIVLTTSPTFRQVRTQLWTEIHRAIALSGFGFGEVKATELKLRGDHNRALGLSTNRAENFQGYHGRQVLIIADEAPGIPSGIWDAIAGTMAGGKVHVVMAGNPTIPSGAFYDAFTRERKNWNCITIDSFDSPNLAGITLQQLLEMDPTPGGPLDHNPVPYLVTKRWIHDQYMSWWHGDERSSPSWVSRVRGQFPDQALNSLFKLLWLERARGCTLSNAAAHRDLRLVAGVDVGGGQAETVVYLCEVGPGINRILKMGAWRGQDTRGEVVALLAPYRERLTLVRVDAIGIGHNFGLHLRDQGFKVDLVNVAQPCESKPELDANDPAARFANEKARRYQNLADAFERDLVEGLTDDETIAQLSRLLYEIDSRGRVKIESKESAAQRGEPSPDRAEALMLALGEPPAIMEFRSVRELAVPSRPNPFFEEDNPLRYSGLGTLLKTRRFGRGAF